MISPHIHLTLVDPDSILPQTRIGQTHTLQLSQGPECDIFLMFFHVFCIQSTRIHIIIKLATITSIISGYIIPTIIIPIIIIVVAIRQLCSRFVDCIPHFH